MNFHATLDIVFCDIPPGAVPAKERMMSSKRYIRELEQRYNPDNDLCAGTNCSPVHYNTWALLQIIREQQARIEKLERRLQAHVNQQNNYDFEGV